MSLIKRGNVWHFAFRWNGKRIRRDDALTASDPLRLALGELASQRSTRRISAGAAVRLGGHRDDQRQQARAAAELFRLTGGNPFYVTEVLQAGKDEVPPSARDAVLARAARLSSAARHVLDGAALTGSRFELPLLTAVTACQPEQLDEPIASGLLSADGDGGWLKFRHEIARLAVEQAVAATAPRRSTPASSRPAQPWPDRRRPARLSR